MKKINHRFNGSVMRNFFKQPTRIICLIFTLLICFSISTADERRNDSLALVELYSSTGGTSWETQWVLSETMDNWHGITVTNNRVTQVYLYNNGLDGTIPNALGNLTKLELLTLSFSSLTGNIPSSLGELDELQYLQLNNNSITDQIPSSLGNLSNLKQLLLDNNNLTGPIPDELGDLSNLEKLHLDHNNLSNSIPSSIGGLSKLIEFYIAGNSITGTIPSSFSGLKSLYRFWATLNKLSGTVPSELGELNSTLRRLELGQNLLTGLGESIVNLTNLTNTDLSNNYFCNLSQDLKDWADTHDPDWNTTQDCRGSDSLALVALYDNTNGASWITSTNWKTSNSLDTWHGVTLTDGRVTQLILIENDLNGTLPAALGNLSELTNLLLNKNNLSGSIPSSLGKFEKLKVLNLGGNDLEGAIPNSFGNLVDLEDMMLYHNQLSEGIPPSLGNLTNLQYLWLHNNNLEDTIPTHIGNLSNLISLNLSNNQLTESIPSSLGDLLNLEKLYLNANDLTGSIPSSLGNLAKLKVLNLGGNDLEGAIPSSFGDLTDLEDLRLYHNQLSGGLPSSLGNLTNLIYLWLYNNNLSEEVPSNFANLTNLIELYMFNNNFSGRLSTWIGDFTRLQSLQLHNNQFSGNIPSQLGNCTDLKILRLYNNQLFGAVPPEIGDLSNLTHLQIDQNKLTNLSDNIVQLNDLTGCNLADNNFCKLSPDVIMWADTIDPDWNGTQRCQAPNYTSAVAYVDNIAVFTTDQDLNYQMEYCNIVSSGGVEGRIIDNDTVSVSQYYLKDHLGSTRSVIDDQNYLADVSAYLPYGTMKTGADIGYVSSEITFRDKFTGKEWDNEGSVNGGTGISCYYFGARYFDPEVGIWLSTDKASQFFNSYGYTTNPIMMVDPDGNYVIGAIVGGLIGGYMGGVMSSGSFNPADWEAQDWLGAGMGAVSGAMMGSGIENNIIADRWASGKIHTRYGYSGSRYLMKTNPALLDAYVAKYDRSYQLPFAGGEEGPIIMVDTEKKTLLFYDQNGAVEMHGKVIVGCEDSPTKTGTFQSKYWTKDKTNLKYGPVPWSKDKTNPYGPYYLGIYDQKGNYQAFGIHGRSGGMNNRIHSRIPRWIAEPLGLRSKYNYCSHGCIRLSNNNIVKLHGLTPKPYGMPIIIQ